MHIASMMTSDDNNAAKRWWAPCSPPDNIADSNGMISLPTILSTRAGGGWKGGRGLWMSYLSTTEGAHRDTQGIYSQHDAPRLMDNNLKQWYGTPTM
jgi:hypothetical protein